jgi:biopolymer transport protein ExbB
MDLSARFLAFTLHGASWVLWLLVILSVGSVAVTIERVWYFARYRIDTGGLLATARLLLEKDRPVGAVDAPAALAGAIDGAKARERLRFERHLAYLATLGSSAPFIGLFGTVLGIIRAFHDLASNQTGGPSVVMAGISEALVTTAVGLMVAIPAVVAFNYFSRRVQIRMTDVDWMANLALTRLIGTGSYPGPDGSAEVRTGRGAGLGEAG